MIVAQCSMHTIMSTLCRSSFEGALVGDVIMKIDSHISESKMDSATGMAGTFVVCFLYGPFVLNLRKFGKGIVQAQEHFKHCANKPKKSYRKISIYIGMYV